jgi:hypothetical protein
MSNITIQCKLVTTEVTRHDIWHLMAEKHTPLINELLKCIAQDSHFEEWCHTGKIPLEADLKIPHSYAAAEAFLD